MARKIQKEIEKKLIGLEMEEDIESSWKKIDESIRNAADKV